MATKKKGPTVIKGTIEEITAKLKKANRNLHKNLDPNERDYEITSANIKDLLCNYELTVTGEVNHGDLNKIKGSGIVSDDMLTAMSRFNVHLACLDDAFKTAGYEVADIDKERGHELTGYYVTTGFKIKGSKGNESLILIGSKYVSLAGDHMELTTPKIPLDQSSSYTWHNELSECVEKIREEVALYREGKYTEKEPKEKEDQNQIPLFGDELDKKLAEESDFDEKFNS